MNGLHDCSLSKTNSYGIVPVCSCGWIGAVHLSYLHQTPDMKRSVRVYEAAERDAMTEHADHVKRDGSLTATQIVDPAALAHLVIPNRSVEP